MAVTPRLAAHAPIGVNQILFAGVVLAAVLMFPPLAARAEWQNTFSTYFIAIVLESVPYILVGSLIAGVIDVFLPAQLLPRLVRRLGVWGIPATALVSPAFPACECGVLAVARGLMGKGLPLPHTVTYLLAGPILNPTVLFTTWLAFQDARYPLLRAGGALVVSIAVGLLLWRSNPTKALLPHILDKHGCDDTECGHDHQDVPVFTHILHGNAEVTEPAVRASGLRWAWSSTATVSAHVLEHFLEMAAFFLVGVFLASLMKTFVPSSHLAAIGTGALSGPLVMMGAAFVLSLCAEADAFVAASFTDFTLPAQLAFLVFGPMFDIKLFLMYRAVFKVRFIMLLAFLITVLVAAYVAVVGLVLP